MKIHYETLNNNNDIGSFRESQVFEDRLQVEAMSWVAPVVGGAAGGFVFVTVVVTFLYKVCCTKKKSTKRLDSSFRTDTVIRHISAVSITSLVSEEPERLPSGGRILLQKASVSGTHKDHKPVLRFSEPIMSTSNMKTDTTEPTRPQSDSATKHGATINPGRALNQSRSDGAIKNPNIRESSLFVTGNSRFYTKTKRDESTDSGVVEDIPVWSMESMEYHSSSTTNLIEITAM